jgi:hypothetical protein
VLAVRTLRTCLWICVVAGVLGCNRKVTRKFFASCATDADCASGLCREAVCTRSCASDDQCGDGVCVQSVCAPYATVRCESDAACQKLLVPGGCKVGTCVAGRCSATVSCDDANPCTTDACDQAVCRHDPGSGPCDDGDACTSGDVCKTGTCAGVALDCSDQDPCTTDSCGAKGCAHLQIAGCCTPKLSGGATVACSKTGPAGQCAGIVQICNGIEACDAATPATETCNGQDDDCDGAIDEGTCDDGNVCTEDSCVPAKGCSHVAGSGECDDGNACTGPGSCVGGTCAAGQANLWNLTVGGLGDDTGRGVVLLPGAGTQTAAVVISGGTQGAAGTTQQGLVAAFDLAGGKLWSNALVGNGNLANLTVVPGGIVAVGQILATGQTLSDGWIVHLGGQGNPLGSLTTGGPLGDVLRDVVVAPDGTLAAAGLTGAGGQHKVWVVGIDAAVSKITWEQQLAPGGYDDGRALAVLPDGGLAVVGSSAPTSTVAPDGLLVRTDAKGNALWSKTYGGATTALNDVVIQGDGLVMAGAHAASGQTSQMFLVRVDAAGAVLWQQLYASPVDGIVFGLLVTDTGYLLAGTGRPTAGVALDAWTLRADPLGNLASSWTMPSVGDDRIQAIAAMPDGGMLLAGSNSATSNGKPDVWVARTDAFSHASCAQAGVCAGLAGSACDDGNPCTADGCDAAQGCMHSPLPEASPCAKGSCQAGVCK